MPEPFLEPLVERLKDMTHIRSQVLTSVTATSPPFVFAYSPLDRDMLRFEATRMVEARLTHAWHALTAHCCKRPGALVVDVGSNYGWYSLLSASLGCSVAVFEPVAEFREVLALGLRLNAQLSERVRVYPNIVYDTAGLNMTLRVPVPVPGSKYKRLLGMAGIVDGAFGLVKGVADNYINVSTLSVRLDDVLDSASSSRTDICMLKADVEGYEPQVLRSASRLFASGRVHAVQIELTKPPRERGEAARRQRAATVEMLRALAGNGFELRQVPNELVDSNASLPPRGQPWNGESARRAWNTLPPFPSEAVLERTRRRMKRSGGAARRRASNDAASVRQAAMQMAVSRDVATQSTNLIGRQVRRYL